MPAGDYFSHSGILGGLGMFPLRSPFPLDSHTVMPAHKFATPKPKRPTLKSLLGLRARPRKFRDKT